MNRKKSGEAGGEVGILLHLLDEAYEKMAWHGPNLAGSLRGVTAKDAAWRPAPGRHNIQELAVHAAYWKYVARRRIKGEKRGSFPIEGSNWITLSAPDEASWKSARQILDREHRALRAVVASFPPERRRKALPGTRGRTALREIAGSAMHDVYHTGQIQLVKALRKKRRAG